MSRKIVECVPNFSEGRDMSKMKQITDAIEGVSGVTLLDVDPGADTNRTVVTFIGDPDSVAEAAFQAIKKAAQVIDMSTHSGAHPRMGATDVCPFVPVSGVTMEDCAEIARKVGKRVGEELGIPVYLYEEAASNPERKNLANVRRGEYEGLPEKLKDPKWKPDFGPAEFNPKTGATAIGAREFLIAYNITLNSREKKYATDIAFELREKGRVARTGNTKPFYFKGKIQFYEENKFPCGNCDFIGKTFDETVAHCKNEHGYDLIHLFHLHGVDPSNPVGQKVRRAGKFSHCKAIGWYVDEYDRAQISINLTNYKITPPHIVLEEARKLAAERGLVITGSEIVGLVPLQALMDAGLFYLRQQGKSTGVPFEDILKTAVYSMGLNDVSPFEIEKKVLGLPEKMENALVDMTVSDFTDEVSRDTPAPGGGSIAALAGALGAALASMVANLTQGKEGTEEIDTALVEIADEAQRLKADLVKAIDDDTNAFNAYMEALRLPKNTDEEKAYRLQKMQEGLKIAINVPFNTAKNSYEAMKLCRKAIEIGNPNSVTDAGVGGQMGFAGVRGGIWNVVINLKGIKDQQFVEDMMNECRNLLEEARSLLHEIDEAVEAKLQAMLNK